MTQARRNLQSGVTLIETLVALFVIALMATAGAIMTGQSLRGARNVEAIGTEAANIASAIGIIRADLAAFVPRASQDAVMLAPPSLFQGYAPRHDGRVMVFVRNGWANPAGELRSGLQRVEYIFEREQLIRRSWSAPDPGPGTKVADDVLLVGITKFDAQYGRGEAWADEWVTLPGMGDPLPQKAELVITMPENDILRTRLLIGDGT